ncbi:hypothetical protein HHI36_014269 [Cryptolaemus montrouzieri]|uniref:Uncharacterized protein n=1 Tax=Cryptolaemus montrouzieri TaxID=559131 RepID=A0ABD2N3C5_9CUCU
MSDEDLSDPYKDDSDDEYIESESYSEESDYDEPATKLKKSQNLEAASTSKNTIRPNRENDSSDSSSSDDDSENIHTIDNEVLTCCANKGVTSQVIDDLSDKSPNNFFKYLISDNIIKIMVEKTIRYASQVIKNGTFL